MSTFSLPVEPKSTRANFFHHLNSHEGNFLVLLQTILLQRIFCGGEKRVSHIIFEFCFNKSREKRSLARARRLSEEKRER